MGTSTSSKGGKTGSPFDPEWLAPDPGGDGDTADGSDGSPDSQEVGSSNGSDADSGADGISDSGETGDDLNGEDTSGSISMHPRYGSAKSSMASYLGGGGRGALQKAARKMVNSGMGGSRRAASRTRAAAAGAARLGSFLAAARDGSNPQVTDWVTKIRSQNLAANDLILEIIKEVMPETGSLDDESLRKAAADALGELYEDSPDVDVFNLTDDQIDEVIAITVANEVCNRMDLQLGQAYEKLKYDPSQVQVCRNDMQEYVQGQVRALMEQPGMKGQPPEVLAKKVHLMAWKVFGSE